ncbi:MAG: hypothetical protein ACQERZ_09380 [Fusobacteriota bacterium]
MIQILKKKKVIIVVCGHPGYPRSHPIWSDAVAILDTKGEIWIEFQDGYCTVEEFDEGLASSSDFDQEEYIRKQLEEDFTPHRY